MEKKTTKEKPIETAIDAEVTPKKAKKEKPIPKDAFYGTGKRKTAIAKVWIYPGKGKITINTKEAKEYIKSDLLMTIIKKPLSKLNIEGKYDCTITALGGGLTAQAGACQLGVARALLTMNSEFRLPLKEDGLLTRDSRVKERKKYGRKRARKGFQYRKR